MDLTFNHVQHHYGATQVLHDISLTASQGQILCLLGPSGGGKSTLLRLAAGLESVQQGRITLGDDLLAAPDHNPPPEQRPVGLVFQDHVLFPHLTVAANVAFGLRKLPAKQRTARVREQLEAVGLQGFEARYSHTLSGGQQQRVALARALAPAPAVMLLDEPFASVDATLRRTLRDTARRALRAAGTTAVVVTHDPDEAMQLADQIAVMDGGRIAQSGTPEALWNRPSTAAVAQLFGQAQALPAEVIAGRARCVFGEVATTLAAGVATLIVRPAAVRVSLAATTDANAEVLDIRYTGDGYQLTLQSSTEPDLTLRSRVAEVTGLSVGAGVSTTLASDGVFAFATTPSNSDHPGN